MIGLRGTFRQRMTEALEASEDARRVQEAMIKPLIATVRNELTTRARARDARPPTEKEITTTATYRVDRDPNVNYMVGKDRWGYGLATAYGVAALLEAADRTNKLLAELIEELRAR